MKMNQLRIAVAAVLAAAPLMVSATETPGSVEARLKALEDRQNQLERQLVERVRKSPEYWPACAKTGAADSAGIIARRRKLHLIAVSVFQSTWLAFA